jgi:predicted nucleic acid-binding protein
VRFLIDTCVISEGRKPQPHQAVVSWFRQVDEAHLFISALTLGELEKGALRLPEGRKRKDLLEWIHEDVFPRFEGHILAVDENVAWKWGELQAEAERHGKSLPILDSLLAATALVHGLTMVTRNNADMAATGVPLFNPWTA